MLVMHENFITASHGVMIQAWYAKANPAEKLQITVISNRWPGATASSGNLAAAEIHCLV